MKYSKAIYAMFFFLVLFLSACQVRDNTEDSVLLANRYANQFIASEFESYLKSNGITDYFITEIVRGSQDFEKAFRFTSNENDVMAWGCRIRLNSFSTTGTRAKKMLDFEILDEGADFAEKLFTEAELYRTRSISSYSSSNGNDTVSVTLPPAWSWQVIGEYFRNHKDDNSFPSNNSLKEYVCEYWKDFYDQSFRTDSADECPVADCQVNDDFSISLMLKAYVKKASLQNNQMNLTNSIKAFEDAGTDGIQRIEHSSDYRTINVFLDREFLENKLRKSGKHQIEETNFLFFLIRYQVWQGVLPDVLFAEINIFDNTTGEIISSETLIGNIWLEY